MMAYTSVVILYTECNGKMRTHFGREFCIPKEDEMSTSTCFRNHLIHSWESIRVQPQSQWHLQLKVYVHPFLKAVRLGMHMPCPVLNFANVWPQLAKRLMNRSTRMHVTQVITTQFNNSRLSIKRCDSDTRMKTKHLPEQTRTQIRRNRDSNMKKQEINKGKNKCKNIGKYAD